VRQVHHALDIVVDSGICFSLESSAAFWYSYLQSMQRLSKSLFDFFMEFGYALLIGMGCHPGLQRGANP